MRRSVSAAYYAVFHHLARTCADVLVGTSKAKRPNKAWVEVYRGLDHGAAKNACQGAGNVRISAGSRISPMRSSSCRQRDMRADYDPMIRLTKVQALSFITLAKDSMVALDSAGKRSYCDDVAQVSGGSYSILKGCMDMETEASDAPRTFQY
ncbi:MAG: hypothetical protein U1E55_09650 [Paracoccus sp. (in: a-proteobacteria)]